MPQIRLEGVSKHYWGERKGFPAVQDICLTIDQGEFVFVTGSSGAGKSTLLRLISGEIRPSSGNIYLDQKNISRLPMGKRRRLRRRLGYVSQIPQLPRKKTIGESLVKAALPQLTGPPLLERVQRSLLMVGLSDVRSRYPVELSFSECRRAELACAIINNPPILILDELTAGLDEDTTWDIIYFLDEINRMGTTVVMATHEKKFVNIFRKRVITLVDGRVLGDVQKGRYGDII